MPWIAPNVGYTDNMGKLRCSNCAEEHQREYPVSGDQWFGNDDVCEGCGWKFEHIPTSRYVQVSWDQSVVPDYKRAEA